MVEAVYINEEEGKKRVMNNGKLYARLLVKFRDGTNLSELEDFIAEGDWEKAQGAAHTIKGVAANLSLTELFNQSLAIETQLKGKALARGSFDTLKSCFAETLAAIEPVITKNA